MKFFLAFVLLLWAPFVFAQESVSPGDANQSLVEGTLLQVSTLPPPEKNAYPDCYYTAVIDLSHIVSGQSIPKKIILVLPGFFSRQYASEAKYKVGDKVRATVVPFASMPDKVRQTQQADEIEDVDLDFYFPMKIVRVQEYDIIPNPVPFAAKPQKLNNLSAIQPVDLHARAVRKEQMKHDLEEINALLVKHGGDWDKWYESLKDFRDQYQKQYDAKAQLWIGDSFFSAGYLDKGKIYSSEFIKSVIAFKNYLAARDVDLILVRVPNKGEIVEDLFTSTPPDQISNPYILRMYKELLEADVEIITSIVPKAKDARLEYPLMYWYQDFLQSHPAEGISWVIAGEFAKRVSRYHSVKSIPKKKFALKDASGRLAKGWVPGAGEEWLKLKWPSGNPKFNPTDYVKYLTVVDNKEEPVELNKGYGSPVLVLGSSFIASPSLLKGGTIPHYFAYLTGVVPDLFYRLNADFMMPRSIAREGDDFLRDRTVCLFPFVPWIAYKGLANIPIFDPDKSDKTLLASYSGTGMREKIKFSTVTPDSVYSYSPDGTLNIQQGKVSGGSIRIEIKVPDTLAKFPYLIVGFEFMSNDFATVTVSYSGQSDSIKRDVGQHEEFAFVTKSDNKLIVDFIPNLKRTDPIQIKSISFYGISQPSFYKGTNSRTDGS